MSEVKLLELSPKNCFQMLDHSFNRVQYFSCMTQNLDKNIIPNKWLINSESGMSYNMKEPDDKKIEEFIGGYKFYMQRYLTRDCIENFSLCLDELFFILLLNGKIITNLNNPLIDSLSEEENKIFRKFKKNFGLEEKIKELNNRFKIELPEISKEVIASLKDIRNCLSHNNGIIRPEDGKIDSKNSEKRIFHWVTLKIFAEGKSGERYDIKFGETLPEESRICLTNNKNEKSFYVNKPISFSAIDTYEIALSLQFTAKEILNKIT